ncbi:MAG: ACP S-malonyltransferase [Caldiserica bacterium]|nr:ACP S-malonyltransferase [Caldisericota bacterium]
MVAFLFPGQGSQYVGMAGNIVDPVLTRRLFERASDVLGLDLWHLVDAGDEAELTRTENTQPALFATEMAWVGALAGRDMVCDVAAGHSLGEFGALCCAGVFTFDDGIRLVRRRGEIMARAASNSPGTMAAVVGLDERDLQLVLAEGHRSGIVEVANYNAVDQTVVSGETAAVDRVIGAVKALGRGRAIRLRVSAPFHSSIMAEGAAEFREVLRDVAFVRPHFPVVNNVAALSEVDPEAIRESLVAQFRSPVQWVRTMNVLRRMGVGEYLEVGPKNVLTALARKAVPGGNVRAIEEEKWQ